MAEYKENGELLLFNISTQKNERRQLLVSLKDQAVYVVFLKSIKQCIYFHLSIKKTKP